jgi:hypothetical protein
VLVDHWPLVGLRLTTPRLEIRLPTEDELWVSLDGYNCDEGTELYRVMEEISDEQEEYFINRPVAPACWLEEQPWPTDASGAIGRQG